MSKFRRIGTLSSLTSQEQLAGKTRPFTGDGTAFLKVPGLLSLLAISVATSTGRVQLPLQDERLYMVHPDETVPRTGETEDLFALDTETYEVPVLERSEISNGGIWQKNVIFYVTGEWAEDAAPSGEESTTKGSKAKAAKTKADTAKADTAKVDDEPADDETKSEGESFVDTDEDFAALPENLKEALRAFDSPEDALSAPSERYNELGISGTEITRVKNALKRTINK
ncbi:MAG TPA: hypothetical protein VGB45_07715 [Abditibacterium sp.]|jgi:hypothetical protein